MVTPKDLGRSGRGRVKAQYSFKKHNQQTALSEARNGDMGEEDGKNTLAGVKKRQEYGRTPPGKKTLDYSDV